MLAMEFGLPSLVGTRMFSQLCVGVNRVDLELGCCAACCCVCLDKLLRDKNVTILKSE